MCGVVRLCWPWGPPEDSLVFRRSGRLLKGELQQTDRGCVNFIAHRELRETITHCVVRGSHRGGPHEFCFCFWSWSSLNEGATQLTYSVQTDGCLVFTRSFSRTQVRGCHHLVLFCVEAGVGHVRSWIDVKQNVKGFTVDSTDDNC